MKKWLIRIVATLVAVIVLSTIGFFIWSQFTYKPVEGTVSSKDYKEVDGTYEFPSEKQSEVGFILYPGAKVKPLAYGYLAEKLSEQGIHVFIPTMPFNFAIFGTNEAADIQANNETIKEWYVGGHSLGGVSAAMYAQENEKNVDGVIFLASYPAESNDLSQSMMDVLSIYATNDGLTSLSDIENSRTLLPSDAVFKEIKGGNHAGFGFYGEQKGDEAATIAVEEQQNQIAQNIVDFIGKNGKK